MAKKPPFVLAVSGVSASGKNSVIEILRQSPDRFVFSVSYTTREPRAGEKDGRDYYFISPDQFEEGVLGGEFLEWEEVHGQRYGTKKADFKALLLSGKIPVFVIDVFGVGSLKKAYRDVVSVMIIPPDLAEAERRLRARGTDSEESIRKRLLRYELEMSHKDSHSHVLINDDLAAARNQLLEIIDKEVAYRAEHKKNFLLTGFFSIALLAVLSLGYFQQQLFGVKPPTPQPVILTEEKEVEKTVPVSETTPTSAEPTATPETTTPPPTPPTRKNPPKKAIAAATSQNTDGSQTTVVSTSGTLSQNDIATINQTPLPSSISDIVFTDETGQYADLGGVIKDYLGKKLKTKGEQLYLKSIILRNAGDTGWEGQYLGQYRLVGSDIVSASGSIILNSYYHAGDARFNDYMKLVFAHEYGHHYTQYYKWVSWDLPSSSRFPDSYYSTRPLSKSATAVDYSLGWERCESEAIAEDYSYLYSGFAYSAVNSLFGAPSQSMLSWFDKIGASELLAPAAPNQAPVISITAPSAGATISGAVAFTATASDDVGVSKVSFYVGDTLIGTDGSAPYAVTLNTGSFANGGYTLRAVADDGVVTTAATLSVTFANESSSDTEKPTISIKKPTNNPFTIVENEVVFAIEAVDNIKVTSIAMYFNGALQSSWATEALNLKLNFAGVSAGTYELKFVASDAAGNTGETAISIIKQ